MEGEKFPRGGEEEGGTGGMKGKRDTREMGSLFHFKEGGKELVEEEKRFLVKGGHGKSFLSLS